MSKRNFILLIIVLGIVAISIVGFLYFNQGTPTGEESTGTNFISHFNPFGTGKPATSSNDSNSPVDVSGYQPPVDTQVPNSGFTKISSMPIAGFTLFMKERLKEIPPPTVVTDTTTTTSPATTPKKTTKPTPPPTEFALALRYVEKATGNIYQTFVDKISERKFSGTLIPKVYDAYFGNSGQSVTMRYLKPDGKTIETFVGNLPKEVLGGDTTELSDIKGSFLPNDVKDLTTSPDNSKLFYLFINGTGDGESIIGTTLNFGDSKKVQVFNSPFTEWLSQWPSSNTITLSTKPSANIPGYMYALDLTKKSLIKVLGNINGLTTLTSPSGKSVLYADSSLALALYHTDTRGAELLGLKTLPEKCVWGKVNDVVYCAVPKLVETGEYPDAWYQGKVSFNDQFWKIDVKTGTTTLIFDPATLNTGEEVDATKLSMDDGEKYLFFINKKDSYLWKLDLK